MTQHHRLLCGRKHCWCVTYLPQSPFHQRAQSCAVVRTAKEISPGVERTGLNREPNPVLADTTSSSLDTSTGRLYTKLNRTLSSFGLCTRSCEIPRSWFVRQPYWGESVVIWVVGSVMPRMDECFRGITSRQRHAGVSL